MNSDSSVLTATPVEQEERPRAESQEAQPAAGGHGASHGVHLPPTSLWPITLAFGITLGSAGLVLNWMASVPGLLLFILSLRGWAKELMHDQH